MRQTSGFISTYSADVFGVCSALYELGGMVVMHDASGCNSTYTTHDEPRWYDTDSMVYISGLTEIEAIMGDTGRFIDEVTDAAGELSPKFIAIAGTPIPAMTGFDMEAAAFEIEEKTKIPTFGFDTTGMKSYISGAGLAFDMLANRIVRKDAVKTEKPSANILGLTPLDFSVNGYAGSVGKLIKEEGYEVISSWAMGCNLEDIAEAGRAHMNFVVSETGLKAARTLEKNNGTPYRPGTYVGGRRMDLGKWYRDGLLRDGLTVLPEGKEAKDAELIVFGEGIGSLSLAKYIYEETGLTAASFRATDSDEDDMMKLIEDTGSTLRYVIADPLFERLFSGIGGRIRQNIKFLPWPHEAFSGRIYRKDMINLSDADEVYDHFIKEIER